MGLELYRKKRNFRTTPEPSGRVRRSRQHAPVFVIQKHAASHLHYDFRLELNGVLLSWAVPKGPSLDPHDKRLAMHVEDHPIEYGEFEGVIPPKQYGSGTVLLWDRGHWKPNGDPESGYRQGKLKFDLEGEKLRGGWMLVRSHGGKYGGDKSWLLIKENDEFARTGADARIVETEPDSVTTGRSLEAIAADPDRVWHSNKSVAENLRTGRVRKKKIVASPDGVEGARRAALPDSMDAELATLVDTAPAGPDWLHEIKYDGYRMLCRIEDGACRILSRNGKDWTAAFRNLADALARLPVRSAWIDGEIVVVDDKGRSSFQALQNALSEGTPARPIYYAFDLPYLNGVDLRSTALDERKKWLRSIIVDGPAIRYSDHVVGDGPAFFAQACRMGLEGIISKRAASTYTDTRSRDWQKVKCGMRQEFVIGGYTDPQGARSGFGALLLGVYEGPELRYCGKVGTGFNDATLKELAAALKRRAIRTPPFANPPAGAEGRRAHWVKPDLVGEVAFTEWTRDHTLRHPSFQGLRKDKPARDVVREQPADASHTEGEAKVDHARSTRTAGTRAAKATPARAHSNATTGKRARKAPAKSAAASAPGESGDVVAGIAISNGSKLLYPESGVTKLEVARYYESVAEVLLPHVRDRPLTLVRCPNGWDKPCFYQKHAANSVSDHIERVDTRDSGGVQPYMVANTLEALVALLQMGVLELHPWGSRTPDLAHPDRIVFDFDPDEALGWDRLVEAATVLRKLLGTLGLEGFVKTTGGKGLHVVVPLEPSRPWPDVKAFCKGVAELLVRTFPDRFTSKLTKSTRTGRIFIDYLRNAEGATAVAPYSARAKARAPVAMPIEWADLSSDVRFDHFNVGNVPALIHKRKRDPWARMLQVTQTLTDAMLGHVGIAANSPRR